MAFALGILILQDASRVTLDAEDASLLRACGLVVQQTDLPIHVPPELGPLRVSLHARDAPALQVLHDLARQAGISFRVEGFGDWPADGKLPDPRRPAIELAEAGRVPIPAGAEIAAAAPGPFCVHADALSYSSEHNFAQGTDVRELRLTLRLHAEPDEHLLRFQPADLAFRDDRGRTAAALPTESPARADPFGRDRMQSYRRFPAPEPDARELTFEGVVEVVRAGDLLRRTFEPSTEEQTWETPAGTIRVEPFGEGTQATGCGVVGTSFREVPEGVWPYGVRLLQEVQLSPYPESLWKAEATRDEGAFRLRGEFEPRYGGREIHGVEVVIPVGLTHSSVPFTLGPVALP